MRFYYECGLSNGLAFVFFLLPLISCQSNAFQNPSNDYRAKFRYWLPDASVSSATVSKDIRDSAAAGAGGLEYLPFYLYGLGNSIPGLGPPTDWVKYGFGTPAFTQLFKDSLKTAKDVGTVMDFALGVNQGQGVPSAVMTPGLAVELLMGNATVKPGQSFSGKVPPAQQPSTRLLSGLNFMHPLEQFGQPNLTVVNAYKVSRTSGSKVYLDDGSYTDLTSMVKNGSLQWTPPTSDGTWRVFSFWESFTNQRSCAAGIGAKDPLSNGSWVVDHFSKRGATRVTDFWDEHILSDEEIGILLKSVGKYAWEDSMEILASLYWSSEFLDRFQKTIGYDLRKYLAVLFTPSNTFGGSLPVYSETYSVGNYTSDGTSVHSVNYRKVLNDGYQDYIRHFSEWSHKKGFAYSNQPAYNLPLQMLSDIPLVDGAPEGESLGFSNNIDVYRQFAGPAHLAGQGVISTEIGAVNSAAYSLTVPNLLNLIKRSLAGGFTMHVLHGFTYSGGPYPNTTWPGYTTFYYEFTEMWNSIQPAWQHFKENLDFIGRNQWVLRQGKPRVDLAFYLYSSPWSPRSQYSSNNLVKLGYTYDYLGPDNLASPQATVERNSLGSSSYKALIFNNQTTLTVAAAMALMGMSSSGLPIIFIRDPPNQTYPATDSEQYSFNRAMEMLLSNPNVYRTDSLDQLPALLSQLNITPRVSLNCSSNSVYPILRSTDDIDYVFFYNDQNRSSRCTARLSVSSAVPYYLDSWTGNEMQILQYTSSNGTLSIPMDFQPNESKIVALRHTKAANLSSCAFTGTGTLHNIRSSSDGTIATITGPISLISSTGKNLSYTPSTSSTNLSTWNLVIEDWHSAPDRYAIKNEITYHNFSSISLMPWNKLGNNMDPVSGVGHYTTHFIAPTSNSTAIKGKLAAVLTLPPIQHTARAYINGKALPPIDPTHPLVDITDYVETGKENQLKVTVTTTLFNRVKAEAKQIMVVGQVAATKNSKYGTMPYEGYGLVGEAKILWGEKIIIEGC